MSSAQIAPVGATEIENRWDDARAATALLTRADLEEAHAMMAERGEWVLNEKGLLARAGLPSA